MERRPVRPLALFLVALFCFAAPAGAQSGSTLAPDLLTYLVSKDVGDRWAIALNLAPGDGATILSLTGNIFGGDGGVLFVHCLAREAAKFVESEPDRPLTFDCRSMGPCEADAVECSRFGWQPLTTAMGFRVCSSFFLPGSTGACPASSSESPPMTSPVLPSPLASSARADAERALGDLATATSPLTSETGIARTLTPDAFDHLVSFDYLGARWSISLKSFAQTDASGALTRTIVSMTGNLYSPPPARRDPLFIHCIVRDDSAGRLDDPESEFRFDCQSAPSCETSAIDCAARAWSPLANDVRFRAALFLPPNGLGAPLGSDPGIIVLPPVQGPGSSPGIAVRTSSIQDRIAAVQGGSPGRECAVGTPCSLSIGRCRATRGVIEDLPEGCACAVRRIPDLCIECGKGAAGTLGEACSFDVQNGLTARGVCRPTESLLSSGAVVLCFAQSSNTRIRDLECLSSPIPVGDILVGRVCSSGTCCIDDVRDGCNPGSSLGCAGICIDESACDGLECVCAGPPVVEPGPGGP